MKYVGTGWAGAGNVAMPPNPLTNSTASWIAQGDNQRHYLEWVDTVLGQRNKDLHPELQLELIAVRDTFSDAGHDLGGPVYNAHDAALHDLSPSKWKDRHPESGNNIPADPVVLPLPSRSLHRTRVNALLLRNPGWLTLAWTTIALRAE